jgi:hypothetical protein
MKDDELLLVLKNEALLAEAKARGARLAYAIFYCTVARRALRGFIGNTIKIRFTNETKIAILDCVPDPEGSMESWKWCSYRGPLLHGRVILKSGKPSKVVSPLCTFDWFERGFVTLAEVPRETA